MIGSAPPPPGSTQYNVLLIVADDLRPALGVYGDKLAQTPRIDALFRRGVTFENMHVTAPICAPSRASMMTAQRLDDLNIHGFECCLRKRAHSATVTMPEYFRRAGYRTVGIGKIFDGRSTRGGYFAQDRCLGDELATRDASCSWDELHWKADYVKDPLCANVCLLPKDDAQQCQKKRETGRASSV